MGKPTEEDRFARHLAELDECLANGSTEANSQTQQIDSCELRERVEDLEPCLRLLTRLRQGVPDLFGDEADEARDPLEEPFADNAPQHIGRFEIVRELGRGGYGVVFLAFDPELDRHVALKVPRPEVLVTSELRRRFLFEGKAAAALAHPNVVPVYEASASGPICYLTSEYCEGESLASWLQHHDGNVARELAVEWTIDLAEAMQHAHTRGVLHRDLKPSNILLDRQGSQESTELETFKARIVDFGLARLIESDDGHTRTNAVLGTPSYMSPEQAEGQLDRLGPATDIYGLGAILYELLTGRPPFSGDTYLATLEQVRSVEVERPRKFCPDLPVDLEAVVMRCLSKAPEDRFARCMDLADDLRRFQNGEPVTSRLASPMERALRWCRRNPLLAALNAAIVILLAALAIQGNLAAARLQTEVVRAREAEDAAGKLEIKERSARQAADQATRQAQRQLFNSKIVQASLIRRQRRSGQRDEALELLGDAAKLIQTLELDESAIQQLRNEMIATLATLDMRAVVTKTESLRSTRHLARSSDGKYLARKRNRELVVFDAENDQELARCVGYRAATIATSIRFDSSGKYLLIRSARGSRATELAVWEWQANKVRLVRSVPQSYLAEPPVGVDAAGSQIAIPEDGKTVDLLSLNDGKQIRRLKVTFPPLYCRFSPNGNRLAVIHENGIEVFDVASGRTVGRSLHERDPIRGTPRDAKWSPDGRLIAVAADDIYLWDFVVRDSHAKWSILNERTSSIFFHPTSDLLATTSADEWTHLWSTVDGRELWRGRGVAKGFTRDGSKLLFLAQQKQIGHWEIVRSNTSFALPPSSSVLESGRQQNIPATGSTMRLQVKDDPKRKLAIKPVNRRPIRSLSMLDDQRVLLVAMDSNLMLWDLQERRYLGSMPHGNGLGPATNNGQNIATEFGSHVLSWPTKLSTSDQGEQLTIGVPTPLSSAIPLKEKRDWQMLASGRRFSVLVNHHSEDRVAWLDWKERRAKLLKQRYSRNSVVGGAVQQEGALVALVCRAPLDKIVVLDGATSKHVAEIDARIPKVEFTGNGKFLIVKERKGLLRFFNTTTWELSGSIQLDEPGPLAVSHDGQWFAIIDKQSKLSLWSTARRQKVAEWESFQLDTAGTLQFSRNDRWIMAGTRAGVVHMVDLHRLHNNLLQHQVPWDKDRRRPFDVAPRSQKPLQVTVTLHPSMVPAGSRTSRLPLSSSRSSASGNETRSQTSDKETVSKLTKAIAEDPTNSDLFYKRGYALYRQNDLAGAERDCSKAIELAPDKHHGYYWRAMAYVAQSRYEEADNDFKTSLQINPRDGWPLGHRAWLIVHRPCSKEKADTAVQWARRAVGLKPSTVSIGEILALGLYRQGDPAAARSILHRYEQKGSLTIVGYTLKALCLLHDETVGTLDKRIQQAELAIKEARKAPRRTGGWGKLQAAFLSETLSDIRRNKKQ